MIRHGTTCFRRGRHRLPPRRGDGGPGARPASAAGSASGWRGAPTIPPPTRPRPRPPPSPILESGDRPLSRRWRGEAGGVAGARRPFDQLRRCLAGGQGPGRRARPGRLGPHEPARSRPRMVPRQVWPPARWSTWPISACSGDNVSLTHLAQHRRERTGHPGRIWGQRHPLPARGPAGRLRHLPDRPLSRRCSSAGVDVMLGTDGVADRHPRRRRG